jgi:Uncharacterized protein conserved in bacteria (DUF2147)
MLRMMLGGFAALAVGLIGGWATLALLSEKQPTPSQPMPQAATAAPPPAEERPSARAPAPPPAQSPSQPRSRERNISSSAPLGVWLDHTGRGAVEISECGGGVCGHIVWIRDAEHRSACKSQVIGDAKRTSAGTWDGGWIYDPERKARFSVELKPMGADQLRVMGYQGSKMFNETFTWKRPAAQLKWCDDDLTPASARNAPDDRARPEEAAKADPTPDRDQEPAPDTKGTKSGNPNLGNLPDALKFTKRQVNGKWECTVDAPVVGKVTIPCPN